MKRNRINFIFVPILVLIAGCVGAFCIYQYMYVPAQTKYQAALADYNTNYPDSTPDKRAAALELKKENQAQVDQAKLEWAQYENTIMPPYDITDRRKAYVELTQELDFRLAPMLQSWIHKTGVYPLTEFSMKQPPISPNDPSIAAGPLVIPLGTVNVGGSFRKILGHYEKWNDFNRLVLVSGLNFKGTSPNMLGTYNAEVIIFPQGSAVGPPIPTGSAGAPSAAGTSGAPAPPAAAAPSGAPDNG